MQPRTETDAAIAHGIAEGLRRADPWSVSVLHAFALALPREKMRGDMRALMAIIRALLPVEKRDELAAAWSAAEQDFKRRKAAGELDEDTVLEARLVGGIMGRLKQ